MNYPVPFSQTLDAAHSSEKFLEIRGLVKAYRDPQGQNLVVLNGIDLTVGETEYISIIGHSGCGKSTLLKLVAGLEQPTEGSLTLEGKPIRKPGAERMMVFQHYSLLPWLTVRENIQLAVDEVLKTQSLQERRQIVEAHIQLVHLEAAANKYPDQISGGMKQRVGIARALAIRPKLLLMDEPFGALDALTRRRLQEEVLAIWEGHRQAVIMITHDVDEAVYMSDKIILMSNGPKARIGEILTVDLPRPRPSRHDLREMQNYHDLRNHALDFLEKSYALGPIQTPQK
ncbi:ABC transporter ATP-binding protein [Synechococcus sp. Nb3U1]|uniref:ABC transporter ATP-binding protein n=1 Tax=Synechococcus sp. Nb3U1 TaxID=1914529 RepID=UPI001F3349F8|nr:ABC transporter ATP-binding protein [Synechococcus sp. Nb3U1]MCF2970388.1 ABC transporter ATP-binding protein [Synechococcus sp. Nb3U1]